MKELADLITANSERLIERIMALHFKRNPELPQRYTEYQRAMYLQDTGHNLNALAAALTLEMPDTFADYVAWLKRLLTSRNIGTRGLPMHFECMEEALREVLPENSWVTVGLYIQAGMQALTGPEQSNGAGESLPAHDAQ